MTTRSRLAPLPDKPACVIYGYFAADADVIAADAMAHDGGLRWVATSAVITSVYAPGKGWWETYDSRLTIANLRSLAREGVTSVEVTFNGRVVDFTVDELLKGGPVAASRPRPWCHELHEDYRTTAAYRNTCGCCGGDRRRPITETNAS